MCQGDAPGWERAYQRTKQTGVKIVGIGMMGSRQACQAFVRRYGLTFPIGFDPNGDVARLYDFSYQPYWAVIARDGTLVRAGFLANGADLDSTIRALAGR
ncbi:MAG TPA: TlpA disulfide reductase family protein [bacterium]|nr:TlpA disulfide reductase family protein [bacterium]